ncbi:MAG: glycosyltransferase [Ferruginibacter sp.]
MRIILIGNYPPDSQDSMRLFSLMLQNGFVKAGIDSEIWLPKVFFGRFSKVTNKGLGKWLGYLDKWVFYPVILKMKLSDKQYNNPNVRFHICDHSNSPYLAYLPTEKSGLTCHDVLAIRGAFGFEDAYCKTSGLGLLLQKWILKNILKVDRLAAVSGLTLHQLNELNNGLENKTKDWRVIHNSFNESFIPLPAHVAQLKIAEMGLSRDVPFLLHLGSSLERKNRKLLVDMLVELGEAWKGIVCFAGDAIDPDLGGYIQKLGLQNRVVSIIKPSHENVVALYSACEAFIFPSFSEGFGWPLIEAQACGAPVIASNIEPMPEVSGGAALHESPYKAADFAKAFLSLDKISVREQLIAEGFENCKRFSSEKMIGEYLSLYNFQKQVT